MSLCFLSFLCELHWSLVRYADHSPCVSGAHNAIVTARVGKDFEFALLNKFFLTLLSDFDSIGDVKPNFPAYTSFFDMFNNFPGIVVWTSAIVLIIFPCSVFTFSLDLLLLFVLSLTILL